ncbi:MAG: CBS domain-containing protein [Candidatus Aenigmarchaeota archaeon]|nr:CBS domain-containing protein [Candidatus Aenigmarchaeota archaeon]
MVIITDKHLKELRVSKKISQSELARRIGVTQAHIAKIEAGKVDPRLSTINKILSVLEKVKKKIKCRDVMIKKIISASPDDRIIKISQLMKKFGISQLPVMESGLEIGSISESTIVRNLGKDPKKMKVKNIMDEPFPIVSLEDSVEVAIPLLEFHPALLVSDKGKIVGMITKSDLLSLCLPSMAPRTKRL